MSIRIVRSEQLEMMNRGSFLFPTVQRIIKDPSWLRTVKRIARRPDLFIHYHVLQRTYVLGEWLVKPRKYGMGPAVASELVYFPSLAQPPSLQTCLENTRSGAEVAAAIMAAQAAERREKARLKDQTQAEARVAARSLRKQGMDEAATRLELGIDPFVGEAEGGEHLREMREDLVDMAKERIISA